MKMKMNMKISVLVLAISCAFAASASFACTNTSDADIAAAKAIDARFASDDLIAYVNVDVSVKDGVATLTGIVRSPAAKAAAISEAIAVANVEVVSKIRVMPSLL